MYKTTLTLLVLAAIGTMILVGGCESDAQNSALIGAAIGAGVGQLAGGDTEATLIGSAVGGGAGYVVGNEKDKKNRQAEAAQVQAEMNTVTVWVTNSNGSKTRVVLKKQGPGFIGPHGEYYETMPTDEQLKKVYAF